MSNSAGTQRENGFRPLRYLIIDDFESFRLSMKEMLRSFGAEHVEVASQGSAAIQRCVYEHFDVILCDYNLGRGKNGQHILEELRHRKLLRHTSLFLMVTAETSKDMVMGAREYQPDAYLTKPINRAMLESRLGSLIAQRQSLLPINRQIDLENYPEAVSLCLQALPRLPKYKSWLMQTLAGLYLRIGDFGHARKIYEDVLAQRDLSWARLGKAKVLIAEQRYPDAIEELQSLIGKHPDFTEAYDRLADVFQLMGQTGQAQKSLEQAVRLSPNALLRQKNLAMVATLNHDIEAAASAWRQAVALGTHSVHDSGDHYLSLAACLADLSDQDSASDGRDSAQKRTQEALKTLHAMERRFQDDPDLPMRGTLVKARVMAARGEERDARSLLEQARSDIDTRTASVDVSLEMAQSLFRLHQEDDARELLANLAQRFASDADVMRRIEQLMDEPVGIVAQRQARQLTRDGIKAFERGDLEAAGDQFQKALIIAPNHTALNLNLVQVRLKQLEQGQVDVHLVDQCRQCLARLGQIPAQHRQYRRYIALQTKLGTFNHDKTD